MCCVHSDIGLVTYDLYHQLIVCPNYVKEPRLVWYFSAPELSTDKHAVTVLDIVFGCYTAGSYMIMGSAM